MNKRELEAQRLDNVNELIRIIAGSGRRFFRHGERVAHMEIDSRGRVWFIDYYTHKRIYTHHPYRWRGFTSGGTLKSLVEFFRDHIKKDELLNSRYFDTSDMWCSGHPWGYPQEDLAKIKAEALRLGILAKPSEVAA